MNDAMNIFELYAESALHQEPTLQVSKNGTKRWKLHNKLHRLNGPAVEYTNGYKSWWQNGKLHRIDGPAVEHADGDKEWYKHGRRHRTDGPAIEYADGDKEWYIAGKLFSDVNAWAIAALEYEGIEPTNDNVEQKIQQVMQCDLFS